MRIIKSKTVKCKTCKIKFNVYPYEIREGGGKYCSKICYFINQRAKIPIKINKNIKHKSNNSCKNCNNFFIVNRMSKMNNLFCSNKCRIDYKLLHPKTKICQYCKKEYTKHFCSKKYCSKNCYNLSRRICNEYKKCLNCNNILWAKKTFRKIDNYKEYQKKFCSRKCSDKWFKGKPHPKMSLWMAKNISNGNFNPIAQKYKQGYITNKSTGNKEFYASSYEKIRMEQLNNQNIPWTKNHEIKIKYIDNNDVNRYYVPDILIDNKIIEEVKPLVLLEKQNNPQKFLAAEIYCKNNGYQFKIITEKELGIK